MDNLIVTGTSYCPFILGERRIFTTGKMYCFYQRGLGSKGLDSVCCQLSHVCSQITNYATRFPEQPYCTDSNTMGYSNIMISCLMIILFKKKKKTDNNCISVIYVIKKFKK